MHGLFRVSSRDVGKITLAPRALPKPGWVISLNNARVGERDRADGGGDRAYRECKKEWVRSIIGYRRGGLARLSDILTFSKMNRLKEEKKKTGGWLV